MRASAARRRRGSATVGRSEMGGARMTSSNPTGDYRFAGYRLDAVARKLFDPDGAPVHISSRAFDTLLELIRHAGETLSKEHLMQAVWPDVIVEQNNLNQAVSS